MPEQFHRIPFLRLTSENAFRPLVSVGISSGLSLFMSKFKQVLNSQTIHICNKGICALMSTACAYLNLIKTLPRILTVLSCTEYMEQWCFRRIIAINLEA